MNAEVKHYLKDAWFFTLEMWKIYIQTLGFFIAIAIMFAIISFLYNLFD
jgi:hypothetical protein